PAQLISLVEGAGYQARVPSAPDAEEHAEPDDRVDQLGRQVGLVALLAVPVVAVGMVPAWQFTTWQWLSLMLTFPIATWGARSFHRAAWANLRHGAATMDTLVSVGVGVAFAWSLWALYF